MGSQCPASDKPGTPPALRRAGWPGSPAHTAPETTCTQQQQQHRISLTLHTPVFEALIKCNVIGLKHILPTLVVQTGMCAESIHVHVNGIPGPHWPFWSQSYDIQYPLTYMGPTSFLPSAPTFPRWVWGLAQTPGYPQERTRTETQNLTNGSESVVINTHITTASTYVPMWMMCPCLSTMMFPLCLSLICRR